MKKVIFTILILTFVAVIPIRYNTSFITEDQEVLKCEKLREEKSGVESFGKIIKLKTNKEIDREYQILSC